MSADELAFCEAWCKAHAKTWQVLNRSQWKYQFHPKTLVRYVEEVRQTEAEIRLILAFLSSADCVPTLSLYDQSLSPSWKPTRAWLELSNKSVQGVRSVRLYHGLMTDASQSADGPYVVENGCAYRVTFTYYWNQTSAPSVPAGSSGVSYQVSGLQRDAETGLYTYAIECRERVQQDVPEYLAATTVFEDTKEEQHIGVKADAVAATGKQASVGGGTMVRRRITKNADCTSDVSNVTVKEKKAEGASESVHVGLTGTVRTVVNRNMPTKADAENLKVGESVESSETEGGLWNQTIRKLVNFARTKIAESCTKTAFSHSHAETAVQTNDPGAVDAEAAGDGKVEQVRVSRTTDGAYEISRSTETEVAVPGASESVSVGLTGTVRETTNENMPDKAAAPGSSEIGVTVSNALTKGGRWTQRIRRLVLGATSVIAKQKAETAFEKSSGTTTVQTASHEPEASAADGKVVREEVSRTQDGAYRIDRSETEEKPVAGASVTKRMTLHGMSVRTEDRNMADALEAPEKVGQSVTNAKTPGGRWNRVSEQAGTTPAGEVSKATEESKFTKGETTVKNVRADDYGADSETFEDGKVVSVRYDRNEQGTADERKTVSTAKAFKTNPYITWVSGNKTHYCIRYRNQKDPITNCPAVIETNSNVSVTCEFNVNEFGLYDGTYHAVVDSSVGGADGSGTITVANSTEEKLVPLYSKRIAARKFYFFSKYRITTRIKYSSKKDWKVDALRDIYEQPNAVPIPPEIAPSCKSGFVGKDDSHTWRVVKVTCAGTVRMTLAQYNEYLKGQ